jgi:hypothetical protein
MPLTDVGVRQARARERVYRLNDGRGLVLLIQPNGSKWWRFRYRWQGVEQMLSMGTYPDTPREPARVLGTNLACLELAMDALETGRDMQWGSDDRKARSMTDSVDDNPAVSDARSASLRRSSARFPPRISAGSAAECWGEVCDDGWLARKRTLA